ncbi:MAG TPA: N-acetyltransferase [Armatimonadota bacterium]|jgi:putative acetyltransferase
MTIRSETPAEYGRIHELVKVAFETAQVTNGREQDYVDELRAGAGYIPELALVVEDDGDLIAHIMLTKRGIDDGAAGREVLYLAPVSVALERRGQGIGSALIREALRRATEAGHGAVILVGNPDYYCRFGFAPSSRFGITNTNDIPEQYVMALELRPNALRGIQGTVSF